jgi:hypothetical protein
MQLSPYPVVFLAFRRPKSFVDLYKMERSSQTNASIAVALKASAENFYQKRLTGHSMHSTFFEQV